MTKERFIDPYELPGEFEESYEELPIEKAEMPDRKSAIDLYDLDLHDDFDWLAQPCVAAPSIWGRNGRGNES
jgi:hypothetical protein